MTTTTTLLPESRQRYYNNDGTPAAGGKLWTYAAGTSNLKPTFQDVEGTVAHENPITLDAKGEAVIYWDGSYRVDLKQADGQQVTGYPVDNVDTQNDAIALAVASVKADIAAPGGADGVGFGYMTAGEKLNESLSIQQFGGRDDWTAASGGVDNALAFSGVAAAYPNGTRIRFPKAVNGNYDFQSYGSGNFNNYIYDVEEGNVLRFPNNAMMGQNIARFERDTVCYFKDLNTRYTMKSSFSNTLQARFHLHKDQFFGPGDRDLAVAAPVDLTAATVEKFDCAWPAGPFTTSASVAIASARKADISLAAGNNGFKALALPAFPGAEYSFWFDSPAGWDGFYFFGVATQNGYDVLYESMIPGTGASRMVKEFGAPEVNSVVPFLGSGDHYSTWAKNGICTVRCLTANSFEVSVNGVKRFRAYATNSALRSVLIGAGFGSAAAVVSVRDVVLTKQKATAGQKPVRILALGDSITDGQIHGNWPNYMAAALEGTMGLRVQQMFNIAVSGAKAVDQYATLLTADVSNMNVAVIMLGVNDIQAQTDPDGNFIYNMGRILDRLNSLGIPCVVAVPTMFYSRALASAATGFVTQGVDSSNYEKGAGYRGRLIYEIAKRDQGIYAGMNRICMGSLEELGPALAQFLPDGAGVDSTVFDNIHPTSHARRLLGYAMARSVAGLLAPHTSRAYPRTGFQAGWFLNGWTNASGTASFEISEGGELALRGLATAGTIADGTDLFTLPPNLRPTTSTTLPCIVTGAAWNAIARVLIDNSTGKATIFGAPAGTTGVYLDSIHYKLNW